MIMLNMPFFAACARQTLQDLKEVYEDSPYFGPILFLYSSPIELNLSTIPVLRVAPLADFEQEEWPRVIRGLTEEAGATMWGLATEVSMRFHRTAAFSDETVLRTEQWLVYLLSHDGGMLAWGASIEGDRRLGPIQELTGDTRLEAMFAHLSAASSGTGN
jgi:hypothetical protein